MKKKKEHYGFRFGDGLSCCKIAYPIFSYTCDKLKVTCKRCLKKMGRKSW